MTQWNLGNSNIRQQKPGRSDGYYEIGANLDTYLDLIAHELKLKIINASKLIGESSINLKLDTDTSSYILKIDPWVGVLKTSKVFFDLVNQNVPNAPTPKIIAYDDSKIVIPYEFILLNYIDHSKPELLENTHKFEAGRLLGEVFKDIHKVDVDGYGSPQGDNQWQFNNWKDFIKHYLSDPCSQESNNILTAKDIAKVKDLVDKLEEIPPKLLHADIGMQNTLYTLQNDKLQLVGLIDPDTLGGDPYWDLAIALKENDDFGKGFAQGYWNNEKNDYINDKKLQTLILVQLIWIIGWRKVSGYSEGHYKNYFETLIKEFN